MVKTDAKLYPVSRNGKVRGYRLYLGSTYHSFHANVALQLLVRNELLLKLAGSNII